MKKVLIILFPFLLSCAMLDNKSNIQNKCVCILLDLSFSTQHENVRLSYSRDIRKIMDTLGPGDVLIAGLITQKSISELHFCIQHEFPPLVTETDNPLYRQAEEKKLLQKMRAVKDSLLAVADSTLLIKNHQIMKTEIMGALKVAERIFKVYAMQQNILVVFSDMIEDSQFYRFQNENLTDKRILYIIETERENERLPNLSNAKVYVTGANAANRKRYVHIQKFWKNYFQACGADLADENYGSVLIRFNE